MVYSAVKQYSFFDYIFAFIGIATPNFLLALILMLFFMNPSAIAWGGLYSQGFQKCVMELGEVC